MGHLLRVCILALPLLAAAAEFPGKTDDWNGFRRHTFTLDGRQCFVVEPAREAPGRPWLWRARFFGHRPEVDLALLDRGFHLVYMDVAEMLGNPKAVAHWNTFYKFLTAEHGFAPKAVLEGMSRGGLYIYAWAAANPTKVSAIYADAPVCDVKSWPLRVVNGVPEERSFAMLKSAFGFQTVDDVNAYRGNPIDNLEPLAKAKIPLIHVHGDADDVVPLSRNTAILAERYKALGGEIQVIVKPGIGHKHGLDDPTPVIQFLLSHTVDPLSVVPQFQDGDTVSMVGDSITHSRKWHRYLGEFYLTRFPQRKVRFANAGNSGDSAGGAFRRMDRDILSAKPNAAAIFLGMNDVSRGLYADKPPTDAVLASRQKALTDYAANMNRLVDGLSAGGVKKFVFVISSPFDETVRVETTNLPGVNGALVSLAAPLRALAARTGGAVVDLNAPLLEINAREQKKDPAFTIIGKYRVHPGDAGMLIMAYEFLRAQDAPALIAKMTVDAAKDNQECIRCKFAAVTRAPGKVAFDVTEASLPWPIDDSAKAALDLVPLVRRFNQELLSVSGLEAGAYKLTIDGQAAGEYQAAELRGGINLAMNAATPQYQQAREVQALSTQRHTLEVRLRDIAKVNESILVRLGVDPDNAEAVKTALEAYVAKPKPEDTYTPMLLGHYRDYKPQEAAMRAQLTEMTEKLWRINQPRPHHFEVAR